MTDDNTLLKKSKVPDRIYVTRNVDAFIKKIDAEKFMSLGKDTTTREDLFLFAMALGVEAGKRTTLENKNSGLTLQKSLTPKIKSIMMALYIDEKADTLGLDAIQNQEAVYKYAEEYANTGFSILEDYYSNKTSDALALELLEELDNQYAAISSSKS